MSTTQLEIVKGDSKHALFGQLFDIGRIAHDAREPFALVVTDPSDRSKVPVQILILGINARGIDWGQNWLIEGTVHKDFFGLEILDEIVNDYEGNFHALYNTRTRKGWIKPGLPS
ncbi:MAG TPA: hypothetical protein VF401_00350 [Candidatus Saccharimonadales bacterium]